MILDSNILIYAWTEEHPQLLQFVQRNAPSVSIVTKIETLGYHLLSSDERLYLETFFEDAVVLKITDVIGRQPDCRYRPGSWRTAGDAQYFR